MVDLLRRFYVRAFVLSVVVLVIETVLVALGVEDVTRRVVAVVGWVLYGGLVVSGVAARGSVPAGGQDTLDALRRSLGMSPVDVLTAQRGVRAGRTDLPAGWAPYVRQFATDLLSLRTAWTGAGRRTVLLAAAGAVSTFAAGELAGGGAPALIATFSFLSPVFNAGTIGRPLQAERVRIHAALEGTDGTPRA